MDREFAEKFAEHWITSWNSHDLYEILSHYTEDFELSSPIICERMKNNRDILCFYAFPILNEYNQNNTQLKKGYKKAQLANRGRKA